MLQDHQYDCTALVGLKIEDVLTSGAIFQMFFIQLSCYSPQGWLPLSSLPVYTVRTLCLSLSSVEPGQKIPFTKHQINLKILNHYPVDVLPGVFV